MSVLVFSKTLPRLFAVRRLRAVRADVAERAAVVALGALARVGAVLRDVADLAAVVALGAAAAALGLLGVRVLRLRAVARDVADVAAVVCGGGIAGWSVIVIGGRGTYWCSTVLPHEC